MTYKIHLPTMVNNFFSTHRQSYMVNTMLSSPWCDFRNSDSDTLLVTFSCMNIKRGKFNPYKAVNTLPYDILRFNCQNNLWYNSNFISKNFQLEDAINSFIQLKKYSKVVFFGGSMGGFAALDYGIRCQADTIISCGAETIFGVKGGYAHSIVQKDTIRDIRRRIKEWPILFDKVKTKIFALFSIEVLIDILFGFRLERILEIQTHFMLCDHSVPNYIAGNYNLPTLLKNLSEQGKDAFLEEKAIIVNKFDLKRVCIEHYKTKQNKKSKLFTLNTNCPYTKYQYARLLVDQQRYSEASEIITELEPECSNRSKHFYLKLKLLPSGSIQAFDYVRDHYIENIFDIGASLMFVQKLIEHNFTFDATKLLSQIESKDLKPWAKKWAYSLKANLKKYP